jgi:hypothetical protein
MKHLGVSEEIREPKLWVFDGDLTRRVAVIDPNDGRVIRRVGWRQCMCCQNCFFSADVVRVRLCDGCKGTGKRD